MTLRIPPELQAAWKQTKAAADNDSDGQPAALSPSPAAPSMARSSAKRGRKGRTRSATDDRPKPSRFRVLNQFVDQTLQRLTRSDIAAWLILYRDTQPDGTVRTSLNQIAERGGMSRRAAIDAVNRLSRSRLIQVVRKGGLSIGPTVYRVRPTPIDTS